MGNLYYWCRAGVLAFVFLIGGNAFADSYRASSTEYAYNGYKAGDWGSDYYASTRDGVCVKVQGSAIIANVTVRNSTLQYYAPSMTCVTPLNQGGYVASYVNTKYWCPQGGSMSGTGAGTICTKTCEAGYTLKPDGTCEMNCNPGYTRDLQGTCRKDNCAQKAGLATPNGKYSFSGGVSTWNVSGCIVKCGVRVISAYGGNGSECKYTGAGGSQEDPNAEANPPDPEKLPPEKPDDCASKGMGYISGSTGITCVPAADAPEGQKPDKVEQDKSKESGTDSNGDGKPDADAPDYKKEESTTSTDKNGNTTTKKTETVPAGDDGNGNKVCPQGFTLSGTTCSKTTTTVQDNKSFCEENPTAKACAGEKESSFGGSCEAGFSCTGDAATCASAKASWELRCVFREDATTGLVSADNPGGTGEQIAAGDAALNKDGSKDFNIADAFASKNQAYVNFSSSCPVGVEAFTIGGKSFTIDGTLVCDIGLFIKLMVHLVAYMSLARLFSAKLV